MADETPHDELLRLRKLQLKALQNEVYGGLSHQEKAAYNARADRIRELDKGATTQSRAGSSENPASSG